MRRLYLIAAIASLGIAANATTIDTATTPDTKTVQKADADVEGVEINGFECNLHADGTFTITGITSVSGEELVVPYTVTYEGKEYHCETIYMHNLQGPKSGNAGGETKITPYIKSVVFSDGIKTLKGQFYLCYSKKVTIPKSVSFIEYTAFNGIIDSGHEDEVETPYWQELGANFRAYDLEEFIVDKDNMNYTAKDGLLYTKDMKMLISCPRGKRGVIAIPEGVETLANASFGICNRLTEIQLPSTIRKIGYGYGRYAGFHYCLNLEKVNIPEGVETLEAGTFRNCHKLTSITLPKSLKYLDLNYKRDENDTRQIEVFGPMYSLKELNMEDTGIETIEGVYYESGYGTTPFAAPIPLENLRLPKNIKVIGKNAFYGVNPPTELHLPATIESLGEKFIDPFRSYDVRNMSRATTKQTESRIKDIYCYWTTPLEVADNIFGYVKVKENGKTKEVFPQEWADICTLHVPAGTMAAYRANAVWGKFKNIVEFTPSGIDAVKDNTADWSASGIYTLQGVKVAESKAQAATLPSGIYIVNGKKIVKE